MDREKGSALIFALLITVILFILGTSFIGFLSNDYNFTGKLNNNTAAYYLARAGMEYFSAGGAEIDLVIPFYGDDQNHVCKIRETATHVLFYGQVQSYYNDRILAERIIIADKSNLSNWSELLK